MKKKLIALLLAIVTIVFVGVMTTISAYASSATVTLYASQSYTPTNNIYGTAVRATVYNSASSDHSVTASIKYSSGSVTVVDNKVNVGKDKTKAFESKSSFPTNKAWFLTLEPAGLYTRGCTADGRIETI